MIPDRAKESMCPIFQQLLISFATELDTNTNPTLESLREDYLKQTRSLEGPVDRSVPATDLATLGRDGNTIAMRLFSPPGLSGALPAVLYIHGGGWVLGNLDSHAGVCADIASFTGCRVIAIDYRLAPESIFPAALNDCLDCLVHLIKHASELQIDVNNISVTGDSAGGNLSAAVAMVCREQNIALTSQVLIYPGLGGDHTLPSFDENADIPGLSRDDMQYYFQSYIGGKESPSSLAAPLTATDFSQLPRSYISVAEFDPLRDEGVEYADKLRQAHVPTTLKVEYGLGHSWLWVRKRSEIAAQSFADACQFLKDTTAHR